MGGVTSNRWRSPKLLITVFVLVIAAAVIPVLSARSHAGAADRISVLVDTPTDAYSLSFNRLWGLVAGKAGVQSEGAQLQQFRLLYAPSGSISSLQVQVLTADHYLLELDFFSGSSTMQVYGGRWEETPLPQSSWATSLDNTFRVLDRLGLRAFENELQPEIAAAKDLSGYQLSIDMREYEGHGAVLPMERAFYLEEDSFVRLDPDDPRREFGPTDVALEFALFHKRPSGMASLAAEGDLTYFLIPTL